MDEKELEQLVERYSAEVGVLDIMKADHTALLADTRQSFELLEERLQTDIDVLKATIEKAARQLHPARDTIHLGNGFVLRWREVAKVVAVRGEKSAVRALKRAGLKKLVRRRVKIEESVDREEVRKHRHLVAQLRSIRIDTYTSFSIKPERE